MSPNVIYYCFSLAGFLISNAIFLFFGGSFEGDKQGNSIIITLFDYKIHLHHWIIGLFSLVIILSVETIFYSGNKNYFISFLKGIAFGTFFHGIAFYTDYFSILKK